MRRRRWFALVVVAFLALCSAAWLDLFSAPWWAFAAGGVLGLSLLLWLRGRANLKSDDPLRSLRRKILEERLRRLMGRRVGVSKGVFAMRMDDRLWCSYSLLEVDEETGQYVYEVPSVWEERRWLNGFLQHVPLIVDPNEKARAWGNFVKMFEILAKRGWITHMCSGEIDYTSWAFLCVKLELNIGGKIPAPDMRFTNAVEGVWAYTVNPGLLTPGHFEPFRPFIEARMGRAVIIETVPEAPAVVRIRPVPVLPSVIPLQADGVKVTMGTDFITGEVCKLGLEEIPHLLVMGTSGFGKSVFLHQIVSQFVALSDQVGKLYLIDLKGGVEFARYAQRSPAVKVVSQFADVVAIADEAVELMGQRLAEMVEKGWRSYPKQRVIFVVDEFAQIQLWPTSGKEEREEKDRLLANLNKLSMLGRAAGICIIAAVQKATTDVMDSSFRTNLQGQVCFRVASKVAAASMFGSTEDLKVDPVSLERGRFVFYDAKSGVMRYLQAHVASEALD